MVQAFKDEVWTGCALGTFGAQRAVFLIQDMNMLGLKKSVSLTNGILLKDGGELKESGYPD